MDVCYSSGKGTSCETNKIKIITMITTQLNAVLIWHAHFFNQMSKVQLLKFCLQNTSQFKSPSSYDSLTAFELLMADAEQEHFTEQKTIVQPKKNVKMHLMSKILTEEERSGLTLDFLNAADY